MDFLDPKKRRAHHVRLMVGYVLVAIAIVLATVILIFQANGYGVKEGKVIQSGLIFVHTRPAAADVSLNGQSRGTTDARLTLEAGSYAIRLTRTGYRDWQRAITVEGGSVEHFDYPMMIPTQLTPVRLTNYQSAPPEMTQSPDRRWMLVQQNQAANQPVSYDMYDLKDPKKVAAAKTTISLPASVFSLPITVPQNIETIEWSNDNDHALLRHTNGTQIEYVLLSRKTPASSVNLTKALQLTPNQLISLQDKKFDHYFVHDITTHTLSTTTLTDPQLSPLLTNVLSFKSYGSDTITYVSEIFGKTDKVQLKLFQGRKQYMIRTIPASSSYLLALSRYDDKWLVAAGVPSEGRVYIYKDPAAALEAEPKLAPSSVAVLKLANPTNVAFSANSEMILAQSGTTFAVYDAEYDRSNLFKLDSPLDAPQTKAIWIDSHHLSYVSGGKVVVVDYDGTNYQTLGDQLPAVTPLFDTGYVTLYTLTKPDKVDSAKPDATVLSVTPLLTPADQ